jgi:DNA polymerase-3 subunit epsilon
VDFRDQPLASAELLAVDTETNGLWGDECELTEVGCVLVGGGELHDSWESLVRTQLPLRRGIQRFTGITQAMVDTAPEPAAVLPELVARMEGRVLVAHNASFDVRVLRQAFDRAGLDWPGSPVFCTVALARKFAPLVRKRGLASLADSLGIEVESVHRALPDAVTCARILCALLPKLCANAATVRDALALLGPRRRPKRAAKQPGRYRPPADRPDLSKLPKDPGVYIFRDIRGRPLYVGKSVSLRTRARAHFCAPAGWTERAEIVDYRATNSELGALVLENRLIKEWQPPGNTALKRTDRWAYVRCRLDVEYPILEVSAEPAPGRAVNIGPLRGKRLAGELADQLSSLFKLRHCGRALHRREHPSIYGQMDRCCSPCLGDLDPNAYRGQIEKAMALFDSPEGARDALLDEIETRLHAASAARRYEAAAALLRRRERVEELLDRLGGVLRAVHAAPKLVVAAHPAGAGHDAFWIVAGRVVDWGPLPPAAEIRARSRAALLAAPPDGSVPPEAVDEVRIAAAWIAEHDPPQFPLERAGEPSGGLGRWLTGARRRKAPLAA